MSKRKKRLNNFWLIDLINEHMPGSELYDEGYVFVQYQGYRFRFRTDADTVDIGVEKSFDRWANSCDFHCKLPTNERKFKRMLSRLEEEMDKGNYDGSSPLYVWL